MYLISKILFGTQSTLSDLDDIECPNQFELLGNGRKRYMKERKLVYSRVPKEAGIKSEPFGNKNDKLPESVAGLFRGRLGQEMAPLQSDYESLSAPMDEYRRPLQNWKGELDEDAKRVVEYLVSPKNVRKPLPDGCALADQPCCPKFDDLSKRLPANTASVTVSAFCPTHMKQHFFRPSSKANLVVRNVSKKDEEETARHHAQSRSNFPLMPDWSPQSPNYQQFLLSQDATRSQLGEHPTHSQLERAVLEVRSVDDIHSQLEGADLRHSENLKSLRPKPEDLPKGFGFAKASCCKKAIETELKKSDNLQHMPALCPEHRHCGLFPVVVELPRGKKVTITHFPGRFVNWNEQAATDVKKIVKFLMTPLADEKNLPAGYRVEYGSCCDLANKHPVEIPVPGHPDIIIKVAYCPRDKQFHIYRDKIFERHVVWNPNKKSGNDLPETARPKSPSPRRSRSLVYSRS